MKWLWNGMLFACLPACLLARVGSRLNGPRDFYHYYCYYSLYSGAEEKSGAVWIEQCRVCAQNEQLTRRSESWRVSVWVSEKEAQAIGIHLMRAYSIYAKYIGMTYSHVYRNRYRYKIAWLADWRCGIQKFVNKLKIQTPSIRQFQRFDMRSLHESTNTCIYFKLNILLEHCLNLSEESWLVECGERMYGS